MTAAETQRVWWAIQLAPNVAVCESLLLGLPVDEGSLDPLALEGAQQRKAVELRPIVDLFEIRDVAA